MATTKKTDSGKPAAKQSAARKPTAKKAAAKKAATKKPVAKKPATKKLAAKKTAETAAVKPARKVSAAKTRAKAERKAPEKVPGRKERRGIVVSDAMDKTIVVRIDVAQKHERYGKVVRRSSKLHAHDEQNAAGVGDLVRVVETRPLSAMKRWRLLEILKKAK
jgi:small subunit ribosomal protein S17